MGEMADNEEALHERYELPLSSTLALMVKIKEHNEQKPYGARLNCPVCTTEFKKNHPKQAFCNKDGRHRCKDRFHNTTNTKRRERAANWRHR